MYNPFSLEGKAILVTGASSGIGRSVAIECSRLGARVLITGRNPERLEQTFQALSGENHCMILADLAHEEQRQELLSQLPELNGIVHCAGISGHYLFPFLKPEIVDRMFDINFFSPLYFSKDLLKKKKITKGASVVFITSTSGILSSYIGGSVYSATKGALNGLIKGMALELSSKGIRVNGVMPSMVETPIMDGGDLTPEQFEADKERYPLKRYGKPEEVAWAVIYLLSEASAWVTGTNLLLDGGRSIAY